MKYFIIRSPARNIFSYIKNSIIKVVLLAEYYMLFSGRVYAASDNDTTVDVVVDNPMGIPSVDVDKYGSALESLALILGIIGRITVYIGSGVLIVGLFKFALALKDDRAEEKNKAITMAITGVVLISLYAILVAAGILRPGPITHGNGTGVKPPSE